MGIGDGKSLIRSLAQESLPASAASKSIYPFSPVGTQWSKVIADLEPLNYKKLSQIKYNKYDFCEASNFSGLGTRLGLGSLTN